MTGAVHFLRRKGQRLILISIILSDSIETYGFSLLFISKKKIEEII
jgi:hypothetical protein